MGHLFVLKKRTAHLVMVILLIFAQFMWYHLSNTFVFPNSFNLLETALKHIRSTAANSWIVVRGTTSVNAFSFKWNGRISSTTRHILKALTSIAKFLEPPLNCAFIRCPSSKYIVDIPNCFRFFSTHFELLRVNFFSWYF